MTKAANRKDPREAFARAELFQNAGNFAEAEEIYRRLLETHPDHPAVMNHLGLLLKETGRLEEAEQVLRKGIAAEPGEAALFNALGSVLRRQGKLSEALATYRSALDLWPTMPEAHYNLGVVLEEAGRAEDALLAYRQAVALQPEFGKAQVRIGVLLQEQGRGEEALEHLDRAVEVAPDSFDAHYSRGALLSALRRHADAEQSLAKARALKPSSLEGAVASANALRDAGRNDEALAAYWQAVELEPGRAATHEDLNKLAWMAGRDDLFLKSFARARERLGEVPDLALLEAGFELRRNEWARAAAILEQARRSAPERGDLAGEHARALAGLGRYDESFPLFLQAVRSAPGEMRYRIEYGFALLKAGNAGEALKVFGHANSVSPYDQLILAGLTLACRQLGDSRYHQLVDYAKYVRVYDLEPAAGRGDLESFNRALGQELDALHTMKVQPIDQTLRGGTQTAGTLFDQGGEWVTQLRGSIELAVADYIKQVSRDGGQAGGVSHGFKFSGSWSCRLQPGGHHANHVHPEGWISSAYYARLPDLSGGSRSGWLKFGESNLGLGGRDQPESFVQPRVGRLVLFPSYYWHGTVPFSEAGDRLGIAFDVVPATAVAPPPGA